MAAVQTIVEESSAARGKARREFGVVLLSRLALNLQGRIIYPFLPAIARGLGLPLEIATLLLTVRAAVNLSSPIYGVLADRRGRRPLMVAGLALLVGGAALVLVAPAFGLVLIAFALLSLSKAVYDPAVLAYLGDAVPYERRGRVFALLSMMWPTAWLIGVPAAGFLITAYGWQSPFVMVGALGALSLALMLRMPTVGSAAAAAPKGASLDHPSSFRASLRLINLSGWLGLAVTLLQVLGSENVYIVYGAWLESQFGLNLAAIGIVSLVICIAEFTAEGASMAWIDRIGKRRAITGGLMLSVVAYLLLPHLAATLPGALAGLFLVWMAWDFSIVGTLPLISQLAPDARGTLLALNVSAMAVARLISSLIAVRLWTTGGLALTTTVSAVCVVLALVILRTGVHDDG